MGREEDDIASFGGAVRTGLSKLAQIYTCPVQIVHVVYLVCYSCWKQRANIRFENMTYKIKETRNTMHINMRKGNCSLLKMWNKFAEAQVKDERL